MPSPLLLPLPLTLPPMERTTTPATAASTEPLLTRAPPPRLLPPVLPLPLPLATLPLLLLRTLLQPLITRPTTLNRDTARRPTSSTTASTTDTRLVPPRPRLHHHQRLLLLVHLAKVNTRRHQSRRCLLRLLLPWLLLPRTILPRLRKSPSKNKEPKQKKLISICLHNTTKQQDEVFCLLSPILRQKKKGCSAVIFLQCSWTMNFLPQDGF